MDCPKCGERPAGIFHSYRGSGVGFKKRNQGFLRCRNCGTLLKQRYTTGQIPKYPKTYWAWNVAVVGLFAVGIGFLFLNLEDLGFNLWYGYALFAAAMTLMLGIQDELKYRYWVIDPVESFEEAPSVTKLSRTGVGLLIGLLVVSLGGFIVIQWNFEVEQLNLTVYSVGSALYLLAMGGIAVAIFKKYTIPEPGGDEEDPV